NRAGILLATFYMGAPALAHILTRAITQEGWKDTTFRPEFGQRAWLYWILAWFLFPVLMALGAALYFAIFPQHFDPAMGFWTAKLHAAIGAKALPLSLRAIAGFQFAAALLLGPLINGLFTFGEEFGWRGYLQPKLMPLGGKRAMLLIGVIWGVWHWPIIFMGYEYAQSSKALGSAYPGAPLSGPLLFVYITIVM